MDMCFCLPVTLSSSFQGPSSFFPDDNLLCVLGEVYCLLFFLATKVGISLRLWWTSCPFLNHNGRCRNESMSQNASILSPPWIFFFFSGWRYHNSLLSAKSVRVRTLCIWWLPFLLCQSLLRKAEPIEDIYLGVICYNGLASCSCKSGSIVYRKVFFLGQGQEAEVCGAGCWEGKMGIK